MKFSEWKAWFFSVPKKHRWFIILVLIRPIIDNFYYLKDTSPWLSPLYIVGVLTPVLIIFSMRNNQRRPPSELDNLFLIWGIIAFLGLIVMGMKDFSNLKFFIVALKIPLPIYLYFFLRVFVRDKRDVEGIFQTFLYSTFVVIGVFLFEVFVHPITVVYSRGLERYQGFYSDVVNYSLIITIATFINLYFLSKKDSTVSKGKRARILFFNIAFGLAMLFRISHIVSYAVFLGLFASYMFVMYRKRIISAGFIIGCTLIIIYAFGKDVINEKVAPLFEKDTEIYEGESGDDTELLHGRVGIWQGYLQSFNETNLIAQFLGVPLTKDKPYNFILVSPHNDFLRLLFSAGYIGLFIYLFIILRIYLRSNRHRGSLQYMGYGALTLLVLYSVSTLPTLYPTFLYITLTVFAFMALPEKIRKHPALNS